MISFNNNTKTMYKNYERELNVYGNLYLASKRPSYNLFNVFDDVLIRNGASIDRDINYISVISNNGGSYIFAAIKLDKENILGKTITISADFDSACSNPGIFLYSVNGTELINNYGGQSKQSYYGKISFTATIPSTLSSNENGFALLFYANAEVYKESGANTYYENVMVSVGNVPYEEYGIMINEYEQFPLTEENECKVLGFNINEKTDVYYTSLPYNTMTIEVDNEKGYFTDYDQDSIVNRLNTDCYVDLFIKINNDDYRKIMTMKFDKISSSDYEKAKISFKSNISILKNLVIKDKNEEFRNPNIYKSNLKNYFFDNFGIVLITDNNDEVVMYKSGFVENMSVQNILLQAGTRYGDLSNAVLTLNDSQDRIVQRTWKTAGQDLITMDMQLEKAIIKREDNYRGLKRKYINNINWQETNETYTFIYNGKLTSANEKLLFFDKNYYINSITTNDITTTTNISATVLTTYTPEILELSIIGNIGAEYTISISKSNIVKNIGNSYTEEIIGNTDDTTKILNITEQAPIISGYYNLILLEKQIKSNIEAKIMGLPYIEVGDTVEIETENAKILMTISEIDMNFDGGLTETIRGYELGWDALFPADDLYPSDYLYPNTPL